MLLHRTVALLVIVGLLLGGLLLAPPHARAAEACFTETGFCVRGRFLDYWQANGGLARNGYPLSAERPELLEDGNVYTVQYFERVRMELHPENAPPYDVLLGQFGRRILSQPGQRNIRGVEPPSEPVSGQAYFEQTGHNVGGRFLEYWQANGGLAQFGFPMTEEFVEGFGAQFYVVQYFERARFELHPEHQPPYDVLLGQFGRDVLAQTDLLSGSFAFLYLTDEHVRRQLGRPLARGVQVSGATQAFERGVMIWRGDKRHVYVPCGESQSGRLLVSGTYDPITGGGSQASYFLETWEEGQPEGGGQAPIPGRFLPKRGFGKVWQEPVSGYGGPRVRDCLGYALTPDEVAYSIMAQEFELGVMVSRDIPEGRFIYVMTTERFQCCGLAGYYTRYEDRSR